MDTLYIMVPSTQLFRDLDPATRLVFAAIWDRYKLSVKTWEQDTRKFRQELKPEQIDNYYGLRFAVYCVITQKEIAEMFGITERTARSCVAKLEKAGLIDTHRAGYQAATRYTMPRRTDRLMPGGFGEALSRKRGGR